MRTLRWFGTLALLPLVALGCSEDAASPSAVEADALSPLMSHANAAQHPVARNFIAPLTGDEEVPPVDTDARGLTRFQLNRAGDAIDHRLIVANIEDVTQAHIHEGLRGENGPPVVWLYPDGPPAQLIEGRSNGTLATGTITADDLVGSLEGDTLEDLLDLFHADSAYVNVHTSEFLPGEVRGQIRVAGPGR